MNKKIYFYEKYILLSDKNPNFFLNEINVIDEERISNDELDRLLNQFLSQKEGHNIILLTKSINKLYNSLKLRFKYIEAAGGLIQQNDKYLFIFRLKKWDLPKGKIELGEKPQKAALRECIEECGISSLSIVSELNPTYHIYTQNNDHYLKKTFWFLMKSEFKGELVPQLEEGIEKTEWFKEKDIEEFVLPNTYPAIAELISINTNTRK